MKKKSSIRVEVELNACEVFALMDILECEENESRLSKSIYTLASLRCKVDQGFTFMPYPKWDKLNSDWGFTRHGDVIKVDYNF